MKKFQKGLTLMQMLLLIGIAGAIVAALAAYFR